jgi:hypothetical protein
MKIRPLYWKILAAEIVALGVLGALIWWTSESAADRFVRELGIVHFSTSMIGGPAEGKIPEALKEAERLHVDLFQQYQKNSKSNRRFDLAYLLITKQSSDYLTDAQKNIETVPWPEVRIWRGQVNSDSSLPEEYRTKLKELLLASPTSEAKLWSASWHKNRGENDEAEDCLNSAMMNGLFWDALDAADLLLESTRYRDAAIEHHLQVLRNGEIFTPRAARSLVKTLNAGEELKVLCDECKSPKWSDKHHRLVQELESLAESKRKK